MNPTPRPILRGAGDHAYGFAFGGLLLFTVLLYLRPNEILPIGEFPIVKIVALLTLGAFFTERLIGQHAAVTMPRPFKYLLSLSGLMVVSIPLGLDPMASFNGFTDNFLKVLLIFILIINVVTSFRRLRLTIEVLVLSGGFVALATLLDYGQGKNLAEGYRASGAVGGIFGNPNDLALALNVLLPLAIALILTRSNPFLKVLYVGCAVLFLAVVVVTFSRAGFLTLALTTAWLVVQLGRRYPAAWAVAVVGALGVMAASPGTFWNRIMTVFDASGGEGSAAESATTRWELIKRSLEVMGMNPFRWTLGVGIDNFHIVSNHEYVNHNAYLQVFNEVGLPAFVCYVLFLTSVIGITAAVIKRYRRARGYRQVWTIALGVQGALVAYAIGSFFASVAFLWYVYYPAAFAVCLHQLLKTARQPAQREITPRVWYLRRAQQ